MKIRNGFVSNSSSSSFIVAVARVVNKKKFNKWVKTLKPSNWDYNYKVCTLDEIKDGTCYGVVLNGDEVVVESFQTVAKLNATDLIGKDEIFTLSICNDEGDTGRFSGDTEDGEYVGINYDIDLDYFDDDQIKLYEGFSEFNGLANIDKKYGAGRNG